MKMFEWIGEQKNRLEQCNIRTEYEVLFFNFDFNKSTRIILYALDYRWIPLLRDDINPIESDRHFIQFLIPVSFENFFYV